jgi:hypothetical protein
VHWLIKRFLLWVAVLGGGYLIFFGGTAEKKLGARKVTLEMGTPKGTVRGSSVFELSHSNAPWWYPSEMRGAYHIKGEAPFVDLGGGRYVFMLLHDNYSQDRSMLQYLLTEIKRGSTNSRYGDTPKLVTFDNIEDAYSIREVDRNALDRTLGPGYGLVTMTLTDTRERATQGTLAKKFPALHSAMMPPPAPTPSPTPTKKPPFSTREEWYASLSPEQKRSVRWYRPEGASMELETPPKQLKISWGAFDAHPRP